MKKEYIDEINELKKKIPKDIVDFQSKRKRGNVPTQAFSEFLINKEQGDWAEDLILRAINEIENGIIAVKYGRSDQVVAGEPGFKEFYERYQEELDTIGKRPDLLIFRKEDFKYSTLDISYFGNDELKDIVPKAIAGLEIRSSSFLFHKYEEFSKKRREEIISQVYEIITSLRTQEANMSPKLRQWLLSVNLKDEATLISIPRFTVKSSSVRNKIKKLRELINSLKKRDFLSFTPKVEDIYAINKWIETFGVPHYYVQVFFDCVYAIPYKKILEIISNPSNKDRIFFIEKNVKNQFKATIHIDVNQGFLLAKKVDFPDHKSEYKELERGRLLFYVTFKGGKAYLDVNRFYEMIGFSNGGEE